MAEIQQFNLGQLLGQAEAIKGARRQNQLAELMAPIQQQSAQLGLQQAQLGQTQQLARIALGILGDAPEQNWPMAIEFARQRGADLTGLEQYSPQAYAAVQQLASGGGQSRRIQSTYIDDQGQRVAIYTDGTTEILGRAGTPGRMVDGALVDPITGQARRVGSTETLTPEQIDEQRRARQQEDIDVAALRAEEVEKAKQRAAGFEKMEQNQDILRSLDEMERLVSQGVYTGGIIDRFGRMAAAAGVPFDSQKAQNTVQLRQMTTQLKLMAKPPGMGAMSDGEWAMLQQAIPDPDTGTPAQLLAGIESFRRQIQSRMGGATTAPAPVAPAEGSVRMRFNQATGRLEPSQ